MQPTPFPPKEAKRLVFGGLLVIMGSFFQLAHAQCDRQVFTSDTYYRVVDVVFPRPSQYERDIAYTIVLRYLPSFAAESQIVINATQEGGFNVISYTLEGESPNINNDTREFREKVKCTDDPAELAKAVHV